MDKIHRNKRFVLNVDLEGFFDSFHIGRVVGYFEKNRHFNFPHEVAVTIGKIVYQVCRLRQRISGYGRMPAVPKQLPSGWKNDAGSDEKCYRE